MRNHSDYFIGAKYLKFELAGVEINTIISFFRDKK